MTRRKKQSFLLGAMILGCATLAVKLIGAMFKIPLTNLIGGVGMGDFTIAYDIFRPLNSLAVAGLPVAVSKMVSECAATGRYREAKRIMRLSVGFFLLTGAAGFSLMLAGSRLFAALLKSPDSWLSIAALSPAVFFCCMMSAYRGYHQGLGNMVPTALSQTLEAVIKLCAGIWLSMRFMELGGRSWDAGGLVRSLFAAGGGRQVVIYQCGAIGAVLGVTLSTAAGTAFLFLRHHLRGDGITRAELGASPAPAARGTLLRRMVRIAIPVCLGSVVVHLTTMIDLMSIMNRLDHAMRAGGDTLRAMYAGLIPPGYSITDVSKFLYGSYSGIAVNIFNLVPSLTTTLGVSILPAVSGAWARGDRQGVQRTVESMLRITALIVLPAGFGLFALAGPVTTLLYGAKPMEAAIAAPLLRSLALPMVFVSLTTPVSAVLQAVGRVATPVKLMLLGGAAKLATNYVLVGQPGVNIQGAPVGTALCYGLIVILSLYALGGATEIRFSYRSIFMKPLLAGALCGLSAWVSRALLVRFTGGQLATLAAIAVGGAFYTAVVLLTRAIARDDVLMLPGGEKIAKILEKHAMIG